MTGAYQAPPPVRFYQLPDGTDSKVQVGADGRPVEVKTPEQFQQWQQIQAAAPPSPSQADAQMAVKMAKPLSGAGAEAGNASGTSLLRDLRSVAAAMDAVEVTTALSAPRSQADHDQRANAAAQLAASLGLAVVMVRDDEVMKVPAHLELRQAGNPYMAGDLVTIETVLRNMARERAKRDQQLADWNAHRVRLARERAEAIAALPENRLSRLEARIAAAGIDLELALQGEAPGVTA
jgi:hypothetical protein